MPNWHPKNNQKGTVLIWMILWLAGMAAIYYWCVLKHIPAIEQRIQSNAQTALSNGGYESIDVAVSDRIATISGAVNSESERSGIIDTVSAAAGVRSVNDGLTLLAQTTPEKTTPEKIAPGNTSTDDNTPTATVSDDNNDNIVAKAVIPATPKQADSDTQAQDLGSDSSDTQSAAQDTSVAATDNQVATTDTPPSNEQTIAEDVATSDSAKASENSTAETDQPVETDQSDNNTQIAVADIAAEPFNAAEIEAAEIENKANERIKAALAKQEQTQTNAEQDQVKQTETAVIQMQPPGLNLQVDDNSLTITGDLSENDDALDLIESAMIAFETPIVVNKIQTHDDRESAPWLNELTGFLPAMQGIKNAGIRINQQQIVLSGEATSETVHDEVINQALSNLSTLSLVERIRIVPEQPPTETLMAEKDKAEEISVKTEAAAVTSKPSSSGTLEDFLTDYKTIKDTTILFESGSNRLTENSVETVIQIATILNRHSNIKIGIDGHTDDSGQSDANLKLSQERSNAVRDTLIDQEVNVERINAYGFGDGVPIADNSTPEGRRLNRRIEFNFKLDQSR